MFSKINKQLEKSPTNLPKKEDFVSLPNFRSKAKETLKKTRTTVNNVIKGTGNLAKNSLIKIQDGYVQTVESATLKGANAIKKTRTTAKNSLVKIRDSYTQAIEDTGTMEWEAAEAVTGGILQASANLYNSGIIAPNTVPTIVNWLRSTEIKGASRIPKLPKLKKLRIVTDAYHTEQHTPENLLRRMENANIAITKLSILMTKCIGNTGLIATVIMPHLVIPTYKTMSAYNSAVNTVVGPLTSEKLSPDVRRGIESAVDREVQRRVNDITTKIVWDLVDWSKQPSTVESVGTDISNFAAAAVRGMVDPRVSFDAIGRGFKTPEQVEQDNAAAKHLVQTPWTPREIQEGKDRLATKTVNDRRSLEGKIPVVSAKLANTLDGQLKGQSESESLQKKLEYTNMLLEFAKQNNISVKIDMALAPTTGISSEELRMNLIQSAIVYTTSNDSKLRKLLNTFICDQNPSSLNSQRDNFRQFLEGKF